MSEFLQLLVEWGRWNRAVEDAAPYPDSDWYRFWDGERRAFEAVRAYIQAQQTFEQFKELNEILITLLETQQTHD